jgi:hypothetical protein
MIEQVKNRLATGLNIQPLRSTNPDNKPCIYLRYQPPTQKATIIIIPEI